MAAAAILKITKIAISPQLLHCIFTTFGTTMQNSFLLRSDRLKILIFKMQNGGWPPFCKPLNSHISATFWPIFMKFGTVMHIDPQTPCNSRQSYVANNRYRENRKTV